MSVLRRDDCGEKNASEVSAQKMLTTKTTIVRANGAFNDENNKRRPKRAKPKPKPLRQGDVTKKRCDQCLGLGKVPCYNCTSGGVAKCDKVGFVPAKNTPFTFRLPFGWTREGREDETTTKMKKKKGGKKDKTEANTLERCSVCSANGKLACGRCNGQGVLLYRSADWR
jgi:hypothetical protein